MQDYLKDCESRLVVLSTEIENIQKDKIDKANPDHFKALIKLNIYHKEYTLLSTFLTKAGVEPKNYKKIEKVIDTKTLCDDFDQIKNKIQEYIKKIETTENELKTTRLELESLKKEEGGKKKSINKKGNQAKDENNIQNVIDQLSKIKKELDDERKLRNQELKDKNNEISNLNKEVADLKKDIEKKDSTINNLIKECKNKDFEISQLKTEVLNLKNKIKFLHDSLKDICTYYGKKFIDFKVRTTKCIVLMIARLETLRKKFISIKELYIKRRLIFHIFEELFHLPQTRLEFPTFLDGWDLQVEKLIEDPKMKVQDEGRQNERNMGDMEMENEKNCLGEVKESKLRINKLKPPLPSTIYIDNKSVGLNDQDLKNKKLVNNANIFGKKEVIDNYSFILNIPNPACPFKKITEESAFQNIRAFNSSNNQILIVIQTFMLVLTDLNRNFSNSNYEEEILLWNHLVEILANINENNQKVNSRFSEWNRYEVSTLFNQMADDINQLTFLYYGFCGK